MISLAGVERFVGMPYCEQTFDCADLVALVQRELYARHVVLPQHRPRGVDGQRAIGELSKPYAHRRTGPPQDGDLVLMLEHAQKRPGHAGVFFFLAHEAWVLHANEKNGCAVLHRVRDLPDFGLRIEGYYEWA